DDYGFMVAGSFERTLAKVSAATVESANATPKVTQPTLSPKVDSAYRAAVVAVLGASGMQTWSDPSGWMKGISVKDDPFDAIVSWISPSIAAMQTHSVSATHDPLGDMITFGHNLLAIWESSIAGMLIIREFLVYATTVAQYSQGAMNGS